MKTSLFEKLRQPTTVVLSAGHGGGDPGTVNGNLKEADEAVIMVDEIAKQLKKKGITVDVVPHENGLKTAIRYVNARYDTGDAWAIEIHRSSADGLPSETGVVALWSVLLSSQASTEIGIFIANALKRFGSDGTSWARPTRSRASRDWDGSATLNRSLICSNSDAWRATIPRSISSSWQKSRRNPYTRLSPASLGTTESSELANPESAASSVRQLLRFRQCRW